MKYKVVSNLMFGKKHYGIQCEDGTYYMDGSFYSTNFKDIEAKCNELNSMVKFGDLKAGDEFYLGKDKFLKLDIFQENLWKSTIYDWVANAMWLTSFPYTLCNFDDNSIVRVANGK